MNSKTDDIIQKQFRNLEVEYLVVGFYLRTNCSSISALDRAYLTSKYLRQIVIVLKDCLSTLPKTTLIHLMKKRRWYSSKTAESYDMCIDKLYNVSIAKVSSKSVLLMIQQLRDLYQSRCLLIGVTKIVTDMKSFNLDHSKEILQDIVSNKLIDFPSRLSGNWVDDYDSRSQAIEDRQHLSSGGEDVVDRRLGIPTGIQRLDALIGGVMPGEFGFIAARPGMGKTAAMLNFAAYAYVLGFNILICSGEMSAEMIQYRIDSMMSGVPFSEFRSAEVSAEHKKKWQETIEQFRATHTNFLEVVQYSRNFDCAAIKSDISRIEDKHGQEVDELIVDYLNIMTSGPKKGGRSTWESQTDAVWDLKYLADETQKILWTGGQIVDDAFEKERLDLSDVKYARSISEAAPIVVGLVSTIEDELENRIQLQILKMRNSQRPSHAIYLYPDLSCMKINMTMQSKKKDLLDMPDAVVKYKSKSTRRKS